MRAEPIAGGWRRTIASPQPVRIIEAPIIERLTQEGVIVIACGGGGIPVQETEVSPRYTHTHIHITHGRDSYNTQQLRSLTLTAALDWSAARH